MPKKKTEKKEKEFERTMSFEDVIKIIGEGKEYDTKKITKFLNKTNFFMAPASITYHGSFEGGLLRHSLLVTAIAIKFYDALSFLQTEDKPFDFSKADIAFAALLHDVGKAHTAYYVKNINAAGNVKFHRGKIGKIPHAHLSVMMLLKAGINVKYNVLEAILLHNGMFTGTGAEVMGKHDHDLLAWLVHCADMTALKFE